MNMIIVGKRLNEREHERVKDLAKMIKPLNRFSRSFNNSDSLKLNPKGDLYFIGDFDIYDTEFTWNRNQNPVRKAEGLGPNPYATLNTLHGYAHEFTSRPTIAEVISQIPLEDIERCAGFEISIVGMQGSKHVAEIKLYEQFNGKKINST